MRYLILLSIFFYILYYINLKMFSCIFLRPTLIKKLYLFSASSEEDRDEW